MAHLNEPVLCLIHPVIYGPTNPPRLPMELISPTAPAAAVPDRNEVGYDHQTAIGAYTPIAVNTMTRKESPGACANAPAAIPAAARNKGAAPCHRFSFLMEDECPVYTDARSENNIAIATARPMTMFDQPDTSFSSVGIQ